MTPFHGIKRVLPLRAIGVRARMSVWDVDTAFSRLYDLALEHKLMFQQPALGLRHGSLGVPGLFDADYEVLFPLVEEPRAPVPGTHVRTIPGGEVACFVHRGPYEWIPCIYEKVLDWFGRNRYEVAGEAREVFLVAPDPHAGGTQDDMITEIQVPVRRAAGEAERGTARGILRRMAA